MKDIERNKLREEGGRRKECGEVESRKVSSVPSFVRVPWACTMPQRGTSAGVAALACCTEVDS